jgi:hypothetical protein
MTQMSFTFPRRYEQPGAYWSYIQYPERIVVWRHIGPHCIDLEWKWYQPLRLT